MKNKVYIVTARSAEDAVNKIKTLRTKDAPIMEPTEANFDKFINEAKSVIAAVKLEDLETKFNEIQNAIQFKIVALLDDSTTTGNIWWDFKKLIEQEKEKADIEMIKAKYEEFIKLFEDFKDKYAKVAEKLSDAKNAATVEKSWLPWFEKALARAKDNLSVCFADAKEKLEKTKEKATAPKTYNTTK